LVSPGEISPKAILSLHQGVPRRNTHIALTGATGSAFRRSATNGNGPSANPEIWDLPQIFPDLKENQSMSHRREIAFIDSSVSDLDVFLAGLRPEINAIVLDAASPALTQMVGALNGRAGFDAIHIIAHGRPGEVSFAAGALTLQNLYADTANLREVGEALAVTAYGASGARFLAALQRATGARVAASTRLIGAETSGGQRELDAFFGHFEVQPRLTPRQWQLMRG
jgi:hypothetical protein